MNARIRIVTADGRFARVSPTAGLLCAAPHAARCQEQCVGETSERCDSLTRTNWGGRRVKWGLAARLRARMWIHRNIVQKESLMPTRSLCASRGNDRHSNVRIFFAVSRLQAVVSLIGPCSHLIATALLLHVNRRPLPKG